MASCPEGAGPGLGPCAQVSPWRVFPEQDLERQVLQAQCRRLEAQHYSLSLTAEQLSHSMAVSLRDRARSGGLASPRGGYSHAACRGWVQEHPHRPVWKGSVLLRDPDSLRG